MPQPPLFELLRPEDFRQLGEIFKSVGTCSHCHATICQVPKITEKELPAGGLDWLGNESRVSISTADWNVCSGCGLLYLPVNELDKLRNLKEAIQRFYDDSLEFP